MTTKINTANISDDAITSDLIATDAVVADGLSSSAVALGDLPAGSIVKVDYIKGRTEDTSTSNNTTTYATDFTVTYDVHSGGNKLIILASYQHFGDVDNDTHTSTSAQFKMQISSDGGTTYTDAFESGSSLLDRGGQTRFRSSDFAYEYTIPASPTNDQIKVRFQGRRVSGTRSYNMGGQTGSHLTFIEVAV